MRLLLPLTIIALLAAFFASGVAQHAHAAGPGSTIHVDATSLNGWAFSDDNGNGYPTGAFVAGPGTPPLGNGSAEMAIANDNQGVILQTFAYAGTPLASITNLGYSTYSNAFDASIGGAIYLGLDVDYDNADGFTGWQGRLNFTPGLLGPLSTGWSDWSPFTSTTPGWSMSGTPEVGGVAVPALCSLATPCTWAQVVADYPNAAIGLDGGVEFKAGSAGWAGFDGNVDAFTIGVNGADTTYDFDVPPTCTTCYVNGTTGNDLSGDGSLGSPFATIQHAVDVVSVNAPDGGGTVIVAAGTYNESVRILTPMTLKGYKAGWDARYRTPSFGGETIVSGEGHGQFGDAFEIENGATVTIDGFTFQNSADGIYFYGGGNGDTIINDIFSNNNQGVVFDPTQYTNLTIQHNLFDRNNNQTIPDTGYGGFGLYVNSSANLRNSLIDGNAFVGNVQAAMLIDSTTAGEADASYYTRNLTISNNSSKGDGTFVALAGIRSTSVLGNTISNSTGVHSAIDAYGDINGLTIESNTISSSATAGLLIEQGSERNSNITVTGNTFSMDQWGIHVTAGALNNGTTPGDSLLATNNIFNLNKTAAIAIDSGVETANVLVNTNNISSNARGLVNDTSNDQFDATCNWWGASSGPRETGVNNGLGNLVSGLDLASFAPWLTSSNLNAPCDHSAPQVTISTPLNGANYKLHQAVRPVFRCSDVGSGVASCVVTGGGSQYQVDTSTAGPHTFEVTVMDKAGNTNTVSVPYTVG